MNPLIEAICKEVDKDIADMMLGDSDMFIDPSGRTPGYYKGWQVVDSPLLTIIEWQRMRGERKIKA